MCMHHGLARILLVPHCPFVLQLPSFRAPPLTAAIPVRRLTIDRYGCHLSFSYPGSSPFRISLTLSLSLMLSAFALSLSLALSIYHSNIISLTCADHSPRDTPFPFHVPFTFQCYASSQSAWLDYESCRWQLSAIASPMKLSP